MERRKVVHDARGADNQDGVQILLLLRFPFLFATGIVGLLGFIQTLLAFFARVAV